MIVKSAKNVSYKQGFIDRGGGREVSKRVSELQSTQSCEMTKRSLSIG